MVHQQTKNTFGLSFTYEQADEFVTRAAQMMLQHWSGFFDQMQDNESFLVSRLKQISTYTELIKHDDYLANLWLVWYGSRNEGVPMFTTLERMEKVRELIERQSEETETKNSFAARIIPHILHDDHPATKLKYFFRFLIAKRLAVLLCEKLDSLQNENTTPGRATDLAFGNVYMFCEKLNQLLKTLK